MEPLINLLQRGCPLNSWTSTQLRMGNEHYKLSFQHLLIAGVLIRGRTTTRLQLIPMCLQEVPLYLELHFYILKGYIFYILRGYIFYDQIMASFHVTSLYVTYINLICDRFNTTCKVSHHYGIYKWVLQLSPDGLVCVCVRACVCNTTVNGECMWQYQLIILYQNCVPLPQLEYKWVPRQIFTILQLIW